MKSNSSKSTIFQTTALIFLILTVRYAQAAPGDLDASFGRGGMVSFPVVSFPNSGTKFGSAQAVAIQPDGKIVVAGTGYDGAIDGFGLARFNPDGSPDPTFGSGGKVVTVFATFSGRAFADTVIIQPDGKIVAAGGDFGDSEGYAFDVLLARYNADGSLDPTFGTGGKIITTLRDVTYGAKAIALQSDGKIVAVGQVFNPYGSDFLLTRYNSDGSLDFGSVTTTFGNNSSAFDVAIQSDGRIVAAGYSYDNGSPNFRWALARYNQNGSLDTSFGAGGRVSSTIGSNQVLTDGAAAVAIQSDGKIVAGGSSYNYNGLVSNSALVRYNANGALDSTFGAGGIVVTAFSPDSDSSTSDISIQTDGRIVVAGRRGKSVVATIPSGFTLARYNTDGSLDPTFGAGGKVVTSFGGDNVSNYKAATAIDSDGKIVLAGNIGGLSALFRYEAKSILTVTRSDDRNNAACVPGDCSLREAVNAANASAGADTINFASVLTTITLTSGISINETAGTLAINGRGANIFTIDGGAGTNRIFNIFSGTITISGVTLTGGNGSGGGTPDGFGGAIVVYGNSLTLDGVHITGNIVPVSQFGDSYGGGLNFQGGTNRIINSTISGNTSLGCGGFDVEDGTLTIVNSTISGNTATWSNGGGGFCGGDGSVILRNVTVTNNTAPKCSGIAGIFSSLDLGNTIVAGNTATSGNFPDFCSGYGGSTVAGSLLGPTINALLGPLQNNGGAVPTHTLLTGSPAIDSGLNSLVSPLASAFDERGAGFARIRYGTADGTATVDIGAFEVQDAIFFTISGRVPAPDGRGLRNAIVSITDSLGVKRTASTSSFGNYSFNNVLFGETYVIAVSSKRYRYISQSAQVFGNLTVPDFVGIE